MADAGLGDAFRRLRALGFVQIQRRGATRRFEGDLVCSAGPVRVHLEVTDWDFTSYPTIRIVEPIPDFLPSLIPHINFAGGFCYFAPGTVILDRYHPEDAVTQCLEYAKRELDRLIENPAYREGEFQAEFAASWLFGQSPLPLRVLLANVNGQTADGYIVGNEAGQYLIVSSQANEVAALCEVRGWPSPKEIKTSCWLIDSGHAPTLPRSTSLPQTVGEMFDWVRSWDQTVFKRMLQIMGERTYLYRPYVVFLIHSAAGWFGFLLELDAQKRKAFQRDPTAYRQFFLNRGRAEPAMRVAVDEIGTDYIHSRNLTYPSLKDRVITVIGAGAIGGYLAQGLAKLGAGTGATGRLVIIDPDRVSADNIGRHWLGFESLFEGKSDALKQSLLRQFPLINVEPISRKAQAKDLTGDLVIDATGEEALSEALNFQRLELPKNIRTPLLHIWIAGNGEATQALWADTHKFACYRCLRQNNAARTPRFEVLSAPPKVQVIGCRAFTPYAVSSPMAAAALGLDIVISWLNGDPSPRFRTRYIEAVEARLIKNQNLDALKECPACASRS